MKGPEFKVGDVWATIDDSGTPFLVAGDGSRTPASPEQADRILATAMDLGVVEDPIKGTSWAKRGRELTVGSTLGEPQESPSAIGADPTTRAHHAPTDMRGMSPPVGSTGQAGLDEPTSWEQRGRSLSVGDLFREEQRKREEDLR